MDDKATVAEIKALEDQRYDAMLNGDLSTLERLCSADLVYTHSNAQRDSKAEYLDQVKTGHFRYFEISRPEEEIRIFGDMAMVVGRMLARVAVGGVEKHLDNRFLAVWIRRSGNWLLLAYQPTPVPAAR